MLPSKEIQRTKDFKDAVVLASVLVVFVGVPAVVGWVWIVYELPEILKTMMGL